MLDLQVTPIKHPAGPLGSRRVFLIIPLGVAALLPLGRKNNLRDPFLIGLIHLQETASVHIHASLLYSDTQHLAVHHRQVQSLQQPDLQQELIPLSQLLL